MFEFITNVRAELFEEFIDLLDQISEDSLYLYDRITENLIIELRRHLNIPRRRENHLNEIV